MGYGLFGLLLLTYIISRGIVVYMDFWVRDWTALLDNYSDPNSSTTTPEVGVIVEGMETDQQFLLFYGVIGVAATIASGIRSFVWVCASLQSSRNLCVYRLGITKKRT